jgi:hypothetical protein
MGSRVVFVLVPLLVLSLGEPAARAEPWFGWGQNSLEEHYDDGDIDADDVLAHTGSGRHTGSETTHRQTSLSIGAFFTVLRDGTYEYGGLVVASVAFDRIAQGDVHRTRETPTDFRAAYGGALALPPAPLLPPSQPLPVLPREPPRPLRVPDTSAPVEAPKPARVAITPAVARRAVAAAWRASGLGVDDARIDSMVARSRASALLPEARLRAMRVLDDTSKVDAIPDTTGTYLAVGANLWLEARLTWRLDRLIFADDEPTLERVRIERHDARARLAAKVIDALFLWQRATFRAESAVDGSKEALEASVQAAEAEATLDVLTGGWFGGWRASPASASGAPP